MTARSLLLLCTLLAFIVTAAQSQTPTGPKKCAIEGTVVTANVRPTYTVDASGFS